MDVTVFDEHGRVFWAASAAVTLQTDAPPHESLLASRRLADVVDFDRRAADTLEDGSAPVRWICLADRGAAQLVVQLEYSSGCAPSSAEAEGLPPRLNTITWHPEVAF